MALHPHAVHGLLRADPAWTLVEHAWTLALRPREEHGRGNLRLPATQVWCLRKVRFPVVWRRVVELGFRALNLLFLLSLRYGAEDSCLQHGPVVALRSCEEHSLMWADPTQAYVEAAWTQEICRRGRG